MHHLEKNCLFLANKSKYEVHKYKKLRGLSIISHKKIKKMVYIRTRINSKY